MKYLVDVGHELSGRGEVLAQSPMQSVKTTGGCTLKARGLNITFLRDHPQYTAGILLLISCLSASTQLIGIYHLPKWGKFRTNTSSLHCPGCSESPAQLSFPSYLTISQDNAGLQISPRLETSKGPRSKKFRDRDEPGRCLDRNKICIPGISHYAHEISKDI